ncbi:MAG: hypothetical protein ABSA23_13120 [Anaerolineales bacterium]
MRTGLTSLFIITILLTACGASASAPVATSQPSTQAFTATTVLADTLPAATPTAATPTEAPTPTPIPSPRWFWAIPDGKDEILAFNAAGQVNTVLALTGIKHDENDISPIRVSDDQAIVFFANNNNPKAFLLTSVSATPIKLPGVQVPIPGNGWEIVVQHGASIVVAPFGTVTTPAILINGGTGQATLVATNVLGPTETEYLVRFSADGQSLRYAAGDGPVEVHNRDLQSGNDTIFFQTSMHIGTNDFGEIWYDGEQGMSRTADGQLVTLKNTQDTMIILLDNSWILATKYECAAPCALQAYPSAGNAAAFNYSLPVKLTSASVAINGVQTLDQNRLLVSVLDANAADQLPDLWLLTPDGKSELLGKGLSLNRFTPYYRIPGLFDDSRYILLYPEDGTPAFSIYDLAAGKVLFSKTLDKPYAYSEVLYSADGIIVDEQGDTTHNWVYPLTTGLAAEVGSPGGAGYCNAMTTDGKPICMTDSNGVVYDPASGDTTPLIQEPVLQLSN